MLNHFKPWWNSVLFHQECRNLGQCSECMWQGRSMGQRFGALAGSVWKDPGGRSWELKGAPGKGRGHRTWFSNAGWKSQGFHPQKKSALCLGIYDQPSRILRQNLSKMGGFDFFQKTSKGLWDFAFFGRGGERRWGGGGPFFCEMA